MATFTMELREILDKGIDLGLDKYEIFHESYRKPLNDKIIAHYRYREIAYETVDMFIDRLNERMNLIMGQYSKLYQSTIYDYDPLLSMRVESESSATASQTATSEQTSATESHAATDTDSKSRSVNSEFPQTMLAPDGDYATSAADSGGKTLANTTGTESNTAGGASDSNQESAARSVTSGYNRPVAELLMIHRDAIINVDAMIIAELSDLFFGLWNTGDEYGEYPSYRYGFGYYGMGY